MRQRLDNFRSRKRLSSQILQDNQEVNTCFRMAGILSRRVMKKGRSGKRIQPVE
jgi:hypothetical protein